MKNHSEILKTEADCNPNIKQRRENNEKQAAHGKNDAPVVFNAAENYAQGRDEDEISL